MGFVWFYVATLAHGGLRAVDMATGVVSVAGGMYQIAMRRRILARKAEMTLPDYP